MQEEGPEARGMGYLWDAGGVNTETGYFKWKKIRHTGLAQP